MNSITFVPQQVIPFGSCPSGQDALLEHIEVCGRVAYKSEDKITEDSALGFVANIMEHKHYSVLEHSNICLGINGLDYLHLIRALGPRMAYHPFQSVGGYISIAGNLRAWLETLEHFARWWPHFYGPFTNSLHHFYPMLFPRTQLSVSLNISLIQQMDQLAKGLIEADMPVFTFKVVTNRGITHELVRHRVLSFTQESTRYVNYGKKGCQILLSPELAEYWDIVSERFGLELPDHLREEAAYYEAMYRLYLRMLDRGQKPQIARDVLANALKAEIFVSGRWSGWKHLIQLRTTTGAHPYFRDIAEQIHAWFLQLGMDALNGR